jgi:hypothetical protein
MNKNGKIIKCKTCGKKFYTQACFIKIGRRFCSRKCVRHSFQTKQKIKIRLKKEWQTIRKNQRTKNYPHQIEALKKAMTGEKNPQWKGNNVKRGTIHSWAKRRIPKPEKCPRCNKIKPYDLANTNNHKYEKNLKHFIWLCRKCHMKMDGRKPPIQQGKNK